MNTATNTNTGAEQLDDTMTIDGQITEIKAPDNALVVTNPEQYAKELFEPFHVELKKARRQAASKPFDIKTDEGLATAKAYFVTFQKIRTRADKLKSERKKPIDQAGAALLTGFKTLAEAAKAEETKYALAIETREREIAEEKQRKIDEERARVEALQRKVDAIRQAPANVTGKDSAAVQATLDHWLAYRALPSEFEDHLEEAFVAIEAACEELSDLLQRTLRAEADERQRKQDQEELERLRAEQAERDRVAAEQKRQADEVAAQQAEKLAQLQAEQAKSQRIMERMMHLQQVGTREGDARAIDDNLDYLRSIVVDVDQFGLMVPMAEQAKDMAIASLTGKLQAALAIELPQAWDEAHDEDAQRAELAEQQHRARSIRGGGSVSYRGAAWPAEVAPAPAAAPSNQAYVDAVVDLVESAPKVVRPGAGEMLDVLAKHYDVAPATVMLWLRESRQDLGL